MSNDSSLYVKRPEKKHQTWYLNDKLFGGAFLHAVMDTWKDDAVKAPGTSLCMETFIFQLPIEIHHPFTNYESFDFYLVESRTNSGVK